MSKEMNDRDFKLLVREYFQQLSIVQYSSRRDWNVNGVVSHGSPTERLARLEKQILSELELFTQKDVNELPFKEKI